MADNKVNQGHNNSSYCALKSKHNSQVLLSTAVVQVFDSQGQSHKSRVLLYKGSQSNFITEILAKILKIKRNKNSIPINGINYTAVSTSQNVDVCIKSCVSDFQANITCSILPQITGNIAATYIDNSSWNIPSELRSADPKFNRPGPIDMLIGAELFMHLMLEVG